MKPRTTRSLVTLFQALAFLHPVVAMGSDSNGVEQQIDYLGNDIVGRDIAGGDWAACQALCLAEPKCVVWTLYTPPPGTVGGCWLKHAKGTAQMSQYSISGSRPGTVVPSDTQLDPLAPSSQPQ